MLLENVISISKFKFENPEFCKTRMPFKSPENSVWNFLNFSGIALNNYNYPKMIIKALFKNFNLEYLI
jgi:hypothetical protein